MQAGLAWQQQQRLHQLQLQFGSVQSQQATIVAKLQAAVAAEVQ